MPYRVEIEKMHYEQGQGYVWEPVPIEDARDKANIYWESENWGMHVDIRRVVEYISFNDIFGGEQNEAGDGV